MTKIINKIVIVSAIFITVLTVSGCREDKPKSPYAAPAEQRKTDDSKKF